MYLFFFALAGLAIGSFLNVLIYRLPKMMEHQWGDDVGNALNELSEQQIDIEKKHQLASTSQLVYSIFKRDTPFNLAVPASSCPHCGHEITAAENIPLLSYLLQKGKCTGCKSKISPRYPAVELLTAIVAGLSWHIYSPFGWYVAVAVFLFSATLIALAWIDADTMLLPDSLTLPLMWLGILFCTFGGTVSLHDSVLGAAVGYLILWLVFWTFKLVTGKEGMGYGDFKLLAALGAWLGWQMIPQIVLISSIAGATIGIASIALKKKGRGQAIPFGPYLAIGGLISVYAGNLLL